MRFLFLILFLASCTTERKAVKYFDGHPEAAGNYCTGKFPFLPLIDTVIISYDSSDYNEAYNEVLRFADSLLLLPHDTSYVHDTVRIKQRIRLSVRPCIDTIRTVVRTYENTAKITALQAEIERLNKEIFHLQKKANGRLLILFGLAAFIILLLAMMARKWF